MFESFESKKIAICFSGHLRDFFESSYLEKFKINLDNLQKQGHQVNLFFSIWDTYNTKTNLHGGEESSIDSSILSQLNITSLEIENYQQIKEQFKLRNFHPTITPVIPQIVSPDGILYNTPMYYKIYKANQLKKSYETLYNIKYDVVVRYRANIDLNNEFNFDDVTPGYLYVSGSRFDGGPYYNRDFGIPDASYTMQDIFFYGDSDIMDTVCDVYNNLTNIYSKYGTTGPEQILYDWVVLENKIPTRPNSIGFTIPWPN